VPGDLARDNPAERALVMLLEVIASLERDDAIEADRLPITLVQERVLPEKLDRAIARSVDTDLRSRHEAITQFETNLRAAVEREQVRRQIAEIPLTERTRKPVGHPERQLVHRHPQRRRQRCEVEVWLKRIHAHVGI